MKIVIDASGLGTADFDTSRYFRKVVQSLFLSGCEQTYSISGWPEESRGELATFLSQLPRDSKRRIAHEAGLQQSLCRDERTLIYSPLGIPNHRARVAARSTALVGTFFKMGMGAQQAPASRKALAGLGMASRIVTITRSTQEHMIRRFGLSPDRVRWIPPGTGSSGPWEPRRDRVALPSDPYVVTLATTASAGHFLQALDGLHVAMRGASRKFRLLVLGKAPFLFRQLAWWRGVGRQVDFVGETQEFERARIIASARAFLPIGSGDISWFSAAEALAAGVAVVAPREPPFTELLENSGLYYSSNKPGELAAELKKLLESENLPRILAQRSISRARSLSWESFTRRLLDLFAEVNEEAMAALALVV